MIVARTTAYCNRCASWHSAEVFRDNGTIRARLECPEGPHEYPISSDADLYLKLRNRCFVDAAAKPAPDQRFLLNYITITNGCNFHCAICGACAERNLDKAVFLPVDEVCRRADLAKRNGARILHLFGGEPTLHPNLLEIVRRLSRMDLSVGLVTNGYLMGRDETLARALKQNGLSRVCLQFDSLKDDVLEKYARNCLGEKQRAIRHIIDAGLRLGLNATVTKHNAPELARLLEHGLELGPAVVNMTFASAAPIGRYGMSPEESSDREEMVKQILKAGDKYRFTLDDVLPLISYRPWGLDVHTDCGVHIVFVRTPTGIVPLNRYIDLWRVYRRLEANRMRRTYWSRRIVPALYVLGAVRPGRWREGLRVAAGLLFKRKGYGLTNIGISNYAGSLFLDEQRIARCASAFYTADGPVKSCMHYFTDEKYEGSRAYEVARGRC